MESPSLHFFFLSLCLIMISHSLLQANADLIADVCKDTIDNPGCLTVLRADPQTSLAKDIRELSRCVLELAIRKGTETQDFLKQLLKTDDSPFIRKCAFEWYNGVVGSFKSALLELSEDAQTANYDAKIAGDNAQYCETELTSHGIQNPNVSSRNKDMMLLSNIAFMATINLKKS